jgi:ribonuclease R
MLEVFKRNIIRLLKHSDYTPLKPNQLAKALGVSSEDYQQFKQALEELRHSGHVVIGSRSVVSLPAMSGRVVGTFKLNPKGFGFVIPLETNSHGDLFIPPNATAGAMTGDVVSVKVSQRGGRDGQMRLSGIITDILERSQNKVVGTLLEQNENWVVQPDGKTFTEPISVEDISAKEARHKDKVVVELLSYPTEKCTARGVIIKVLGRAGQYDSEIKSIIHQHHLPEEFDENCLSQAHKLGAEFEPEQAKNRKDETNKIIITIDPPTAKDFDDAISLEKDSDNNWILGVHIADVSSFVTAGSPLDAEARVRGNSIYLPQKTIPMLPEVLSNGICSLQPGQKRFCKSAYITYDEGGNVLSSRFANTIICSTQRLTYTEANRILNGHTKNTRPEVIELLKNMESLSRIIEKRRSDNGMIHLDLPEIELEFDKSGRVCDAHPADTSYPHTIIEMFMVEANEAAARLLDGLNVSFMRRIHPEPDSLSMQNLSKLIRSFGFSISRNPGRGEIQNLLAAVEGADCSLAVNLTVLRSFERAEYAPLRIGHYALASTHYCHFTSPIRRYADLLIHRMLECHLQNRLKSADENEIPSEQELVEIGKHISFTEQRAEDAENELKDVLILQMLSEHIGDELNCVITGLAGFGVFAQSKKYGIDGLIPLADLGADIWEYNVKSQCIIGRDSGHVIHLGQAMNCRIVSVNVSARQLNLMPAEALIREKKAKQKKKNKQPRTNRRSKRARPRR